MDQISQALLDFGSGMNAVGEDVLGQEQLANAKQQIQEQVKDEVVSAFGGFLEYVKGLVGEEVSKIKQSFYTDGISKGRLLGVIIGGTALLVGGLYMRKYFNPEPWRLIHQTETDISEIKHIYLKKVVEISHQRNAKLNILLLGQVASGKSSFINSCHTALIQEGRSSAPARVLEGNNDSVTKKFEAYNLKVRDGDGHIQKELPVRLFDCPGLLDDGTGVQTEDIIKICDGHIKDNYEIQPEVPINPDDEKFREKPGEKDKMHCVVYVIDAQNQSGDNFVKQRVKEQFEEVGRHLLGSGTPRLVLLTHIDRLDIKPMSRVFYDRRVEKCCEMASSFLDLHLCDVLPQANYSKEVISVEEKDFITLFNIWKIMESAKDYAQKTSAMTENE